MSIAGYWFDHSTGALWRAAACAVVCTVSYRSLSDTSVPTLVDYPNHLARIVAEGAKLMHFAPVRTEFQIITNGISRSRVDTAADY